MSTPQHTSTASVIGPTPTSIASTAGTAKGASASTEVVLGRLEAAELFGEDL
jgi:hypothetical protein